MSVPASEPAWTAGRPLIVGILALVFLVAGLGSWSVGTTLAGAVIADGMVEVESNRQVIQHPDGGVVAEILVRDGDRVAVGDVLLRLDDTRLQSELAIVEGQLYELLARKSRLLAERNGAGRVTFPQEFVALAERNAGIRALLDGETTLFEARLEAFHQQNNLLDRQNEQIASRIAGIEAQLAALALQKELVATELANQRRLLERELTPAAAVSGLEREEAGLQGEIGHLEAEIAGLEGQITLNEITRLQNSTTRRETATSAERDLQFSEIELKERRVALLDRQSRMNIRAPVAGIVYESAVFAERAVVQPAEPVMYIVPQDQPLIVSAQVASVDIDDIHVGQDVALRFVAFDQNGREPTEGRVIRISADTITDESSQYSYYAVDIRPGDPLLAVDEALVPGMPVQAFIRTRDRTAFAYLTEPLTKFFDGAFRE